MNRTERLLDLIAYLLNAREPVSWQQIKNHFPEDYAHGVEESNQRKFERDKAELISLGIPIDYYSGTERKEGYLIEKEKLFLPEMEFTPQESSLLMMAADAVLENEGFPYSDQLQKALHKIISLNHHIASPPPQREVDITSGDPRSVRSRARWVQEIQDALDRRKKVEIEYRAFSTQEVTRRRVHPYGLIFSDRKWTMVAWDELRQDLRNFVLSRIQKLEINPRRPGTPDFAIPEDFSLSRYKDQQPWELEFHDPLEVTLRVEAHRLPELGPQLVTASACGPQTFRVRVTYLDGFCRWVLSQKNDVEIVDPPQARQRLISLLQQLL
ncbi:MAG TPA: WYL domain-containing protein [Acidobacteriota bacterium]|nr:WYL domain-containing protein [Acidobacteriota bacterium]